MKNSDWKSATWRYSVLHLIAGLEDHRHKSAVEWLTDVEVIPKGVTWKRASSNISMSLDPEAITGLYLAESAHEFDSLGGGTPTEFMEWLSFEVSGTPHNRELKRMLDGLGREKDESDKS